MNFENFTFGALGRFRARKKSKIFGRLNFFSRGKVFEPPETDPPKYCYTLLCSVQGFLSAFVKICQAYCSITLPQFQRNIFEYNEKQRRKEVVVHFLHKNFHVGKSRYPLFSIKFSLNFPVISSHMYTTALAIVPGNVM